MNCVQLYFSNIKSRYILNLAPASVGYLNDYMAKVEKASHIRGAKYIHVIAPCPTGWGTESDETIEVARAGVDCGLWYLAEYENGQFHLNRNPQKFSSIEAYLQCQSRFRHLTEEDLAVITASRDSKWEQMRHTYTID